jgi:sensor histidine kinase YesM
MKRLRFSVLYTAAWLPYAASYYVAFASERFHPTLPILYNLVPAALLGLAVLRWCRRIPWSVHDRPWFFPLQLGSAICYSLLWWAGTFLLTAVGHAILHYHPIFVSWTRAAGQWQFISGLMVYGNLAGFSYVFQTNETLRAEERRRIEAEALKTKAELATLRAQLNPHFLFNTLHSVLALVEQRQEGAKTALSQLADMLRYTLSEHSSEAEEGVSFREELQFTDDYLALEAIRLGSRLRITRSVDPEALACRLPALTLQPLVENAIRHGIAPRSRPGTLRIEARVQRSVLHLTVSDDGVGALPEWALHSEGLGIKTVKRRLELYSHGAATFAVRGIPSQGFSVSITIPLLEDQPDTEQSTSEIAVRC